MGEKLTSKEEIGNIQDDDRIHIVDRSDLASGAAGTSKQSKWSLFKSTLKTYFDGIYTSANGTWSTKKWSVWGDSFSDGLGTDYIAEVDAALGLTGTDVRGVGGDKVSDQLADLNTLLGSSPNHFVNYDVVSLLVGVNDYAVDTPLGASTDTTATATYAGYLKNFIETLLTAAPDIQFYIMTPPPGDNLSVPYETANGAGWTLSDLSILIGKICGLYSIQCIDLYSFSQFNLQTIPTYTSDGLHPNAKGAEVLGNIIANAFVSSNNSAGGGGGTSKLEDEAAPKLGGNLDLNNHTINGDGTIEIDGALIRCGKNGVTDGEINLFSSTLNKYFSLKHSGTFAQFTNSGVSQNWIAGRQVWYNSAVAESGRVSNAGNWAFGYGADQAEKLAVNGNVKFDALPTSASGLAAGNLWNDSGTIKIA